MSTPKCNKNCLESNIMALSISPTAEPKTQTINGKSSLNVTVVEKNSNEATKRLDNNAPNPENKTHLDFAPWFDLKLIEEDIAAYHKSTAEDKKIMNDLEKEKRKFLNHDAVYNYDSPNDVIVLEQEKSDPISDALALPIEDVPEDIRAELIKRMLGHFD